MTDHSNGSAMIPPPHSQGVSGRVLVAQSKSILVIIARGMFSLLGGLQYEGVLVCLAQAMGEVAAESCWCNDVVHTIKLRKRVAEAFDHGMKAVPSMPPVGANQMPQSTETRQ